MKRIFLILMLVLLPFQMTWAAATAYCEHEQGKSAQHFGHHVHNHDFSGEKNQSGKSKLGQSDADCGYCHLSHANIVSVHTPTLTFPKPSLLVATTPHSYVSYIPDRPSKPNWRSAI
jgi:hypothetical protein